MTNGKSRHIVRRLAVILLIAAVIAVSVQAAHAAVGDILKTTDIPAGALCNSSSGTALALLSGGKIGKPQYPILLVTSCAGKLFFLDPSTSPATLVQTTTTSPANTWGGLVYRVDHGDLLACTITNVAQARTDIYAIDINPFNAAADGTATKLRTGPGGATCGIAWDVSVDGLADGTVYQTPSTGSSVLHYPPSGTSFLTPVSAGCPTSVTGLSIVGTSLFVGCPPAQGGGRPTFRQLDKAVTGGLLVRSFLGPASLTKPVALPDDPGTFSAQFKEILWTKDQSLNTLRALEIPGGTIGQKLGTPQLFPAACPATYPTAPDGSPLDTDGDGLLDCWEDGSLWTDTLPGLSFNGNWTGNPANRDLTLCVDANNNNSFGAAGSPERASECANPLRKDIFVEMDFMPFHDPRVSAPNAVCDPTVPGSTCDVNKSVPLAFANAPVTNPDGSTGIRLHLLLDEQVPHNNATALVPCTPAPAAGDETFDHLKFGVSTGTIVNGRFGTVTERASVNTINAKYFTYHYGLWAHSQPAGNTSSGCAEIGGNDFMVTLASYGVYNFGTPDTPTFHGVGTVEQQGGTLMHEFGHNLGLRHGGGDDINCKPNYESVMSYARQVPGPLAPRTPLDYSRQKLPTLNEASLSESSGIGAPVDGGPPFSGEIAFGPPVCLDFLCLSQAATVIDATSTTPVDWNLNGSTSDVISLDVNNLGIPGCPASPNQTLEGFNDWANIKYNFRASVDFADGARVGVAESNELTFDETLVMTRDRIDFKPADPNNNFTRNSSQTVNVALFSRGGAGPLDATELDPATTFLRGTDGFTWIIPVKQNNQGFACKVQDVDNDGLPDIVCQFDIPKNTISTAETRVVLEGRTKSAQSGCATTCDQPVLASDFINVH